MNRKAPQNDLMRILARKKAVSVDFLKNQAADKYAASRAIKNMIESGLAESIPSGQSEYLRLTPAGKKKNMSVELSEGTLPVPAAWDGFWRIIILDLPEERKSEREALRYLLKKANFACIKNTVWVSPLPYENLFTNIKKDLALTTEMMIIKTSSLDKETEEAFKKLM